MKNVIYIIAFLASSWVYSQNYQIEYTFEYKKDSLKEYTQKDAYVLQIEEDKTKFIPKRLIERDEILDQNTKMYISSPLRQVVERKRGSNEYINYEVFNSNYYTLPDKVELNWEINPDTKEENDYHLQKATVTFGNRNWEAWFIPDIPLNEGPYKFHGLPGLIYEIHDTKGNFSYQLTSLKKVEKPYNTSNIIETHFGTKPIPINEKQYQKLVLDDYNNPYAQYRAMKEGSWMIGLPGDRTIKTNKELDAYVKEYQAQIRRENNPVELDKAIVFPE